MDSLYLIDYHTMSFVCFLSHFSFFVSVHKLYLYDIYYQTYRIFVYVYLCLLQSCTFRLIGRVIQPVAKVYCPKKRIRVVFYAAGPVAGICLSWRGLLLSLLMSASALFLLWQDVSWSGIGRRCKLWGSSGVSLYRYPGIFVVCQCTVNQLICSKPWQGYSRSYI